MLGEPWIRNVPFTKQSQTDCTSVSACAGKTCSFVWLKSAKRTGRLATVRRNTRNRLTEQETLMSYCLDSPLSIYQSERQQLRSFWLLVSLRSRKEELSNRCSSLPA